MKYALLVIDMNQGSFDPNSRGGVLYRQKDKLVACINELAAAFRNRKLPVVWVTQRWEHTTDAPLHHQKAGNIQFFRNLEGWELLPELNVRHDFDIVVIKKGYDAFFGTDLDTHLRFAGVMGLVIAGVNTYACVKQTTMGAVERHYNPLIWPKGGIAASLPQFEDAALRYMIGDTPGKGIVEGLLTNEEIIARLDA